MEERKGALEVIRGAIHNEIAGQHFYDDAARYVIDLGAKELLDTLAREEERHVDLLLGEYDAVRAQGRWLGPQDAIAHGARLDLSSVLMNGRGSAPELFPSGWSPDDAIDRTVDDLSALAFGLQLEKMAIALYEEESGRAGDPWAGKAYRFLVDEERRHFRLLTDHWQRLSGVPWMEA